MRIRNRKVPLPLSSLSPVPISDPHFSRSPVVQLQLHDDPLQTFPQQADKDASFGTQPSNQPIGVGSNGKDCSDGDEKKALFQEGEKQGGGGGVGDKSNDTRKDPRERIMGAGIETVILEQSDSPHQGVGRWCEGDKAFPLKKRRGSFDRKSNEETVIEKDKKMKTKMNKKCVQQNGNNQGEASKDNKEAKEGMDGSSTSGTGAKKRGRGGALMEGSRCSRVNGRGWRCCQQTLVGYSLCEHHLGKGRLRSMNSVRSRSVATTTAGKNSKSSQPLSSPQFSLEEKGSTKQGLCDNKVGGEVEDGEEKKPVMAAAKKKTKLGTVKARSMSSLLGQADNYSIAVAENNK